MRRAPRRDPRGPPGAPPAPEMSHLRGFWRLLANQKKKNGARKTIRVYLGWKAPGEAGSAERAPDGFGRAAAPAPPLPGQGVPCRGRARLRGQLLALCASGPPQEPAQGHVRRRRRSCSGRRGHRQVAKVPSHAGASPHRGHRGHRDTENTGTQRTPGHREHRGTARPAGHGPGTAPHRALPRSAAQRQLPQVETWFADPLKKMNPFQRSY
ncbi:uncharacterized protein GJ701_007077 isoform 1-T1 [Geothlypis trichas]